MIVVFGFDFIPREQPGWDVRQRAFWDNIFSWWLMWTFDPASLAGKSFAYIRRREVWMTRVRLMYKFTDRRQQTAEGRR